MFQLSSSKGFNSFIKLVHCKKKLSLILSVLMFLFYRHMVDDMLSADDVSCSSSQVSAKSEKNMADFDGEESGCEEELVQINSHAELTSHLQQHLPNLASIYHEHLTQGKSNQKKAEKHCLYF